jgi:hypothetical protein
MHRQLKWGVLQGYWSKPKAFFALFVVNSAIRLYTAHPNIQDYNSNKLWANSTHRRINMLVIISDLHLGDGTTANSIVPSAFRLFSNRLRETAYFASFRSDGTYRPIDSLDLVLMGDILDPLHSTLWLDTAPGTLNYTRPWTDIRGSRFAPKLDETTQAIIQENKESLETLKRIANGQTTARQSYCLQPTVAGSLILTQVNALP